MVEEPPTLPLITRRAEKLSPRKLTSPVPSISPASKLTYPALAEQYPQSSAPIAVAIVLLGTVGMVLTAICWLIFR